MTATRLLFSPLVIIACGTTVYAETGVALDFDLGIRVQSDSNPDLSPSGSPGSVTGGADLSFALSSETPLSNLSLQGSTGLDLADGASSSLNDPAFVLRYARATANAALTLDATLNDVALENGDVTNFDSGIGRKRTATLAGDVEFGIAGPLGFGLNASVIDQQFSDSSNPELIDSRTVNLGGHVRSDVSQVLHLDIGTTDRQFFPDGGDMRETVSTDLGLTLDRPNGTMALRLTADNTPDGDRLAAQFERQMDLPSGSVTYTLGATRGVNDQIYTTGSLSYARDLANGTLDIGLDRIVQQGADTDTEIVLSTLRLGYTQPITPTTNLALTLNWAEQRETQSDLSIANTNLSATLTRMVTPDWSLDLGYSYLMRVDDVTGQAQSDQVSLTLHRAFSLRF